MKQRDNSGSNVVIDKNMIRMDEKWMKMIDERILEYLRDNGPTTPSIMAVAKGISGPQVEIEDRCERLCQAELVHKDSKHCFKISTSGERYLRGHISPSCPDHALKQLDNHPSETAEYSTPDYILEHLYKQMFETAETHPSFD